MRDRDYYPEGSYNDPNAPYNEVDVPEREFEVNVSVTLHKDFDKVTTDDYTPEFDDEDGRVYANTEDTDWNKAYECQHKSITDMLLILKKYVEKDIEEYKKQGKRVPQSLTDLLDDCTDWEQEDIDVTEA